MKILHVYRHTPDQEVMDLADIVSRDREVQEFHLYQEPVDYHRLLNLVLEHDQVISWW
jgi:hypothetical protein